MCAHDDPRGAGLFLPLFAFFFSFFPLFRSLVGGHVGGALRSHPSLSAGARSAAERLWFLVGLLAPFQSYPPALGWATFWGAGLGAAQPRLFFCVSVSLSSPPHETDIRDCACSLCRVPPSLQRPRLTSLFPSSCAWARRNLPRRTAVVSSHQRHAQRGYGRVVRSRSALP